MFLFSIFTYMTFSHGYKVYTPLTLDWIWRVLFSHFGLNIVKLTTIFFSNFIRYHQQSRVKEKIETSTQK